MKTTYFQRDGCAFEKINIVSAPHLGQDCRLAPYPVTCTERLYSVGQYPLYSHTNSPNCLYTFPYKILWEKLDGIFSLINLLILIPYSLVEVLTLPGENWFLTVLGLWGLRGVGGEGVRILLLRMYTLRWLCRSFKWKIVYHLRWKLERIYY